jgi:hypothetical protein
LKADVREKETMNNFLEVAVDGLIDMLSSKNRQSGARPVSVQT